jgi:MFS transporter, Spinster family, sphingosine-1-phosphate transporter
MSAEPDALARPAVSAGVRYALVVLAAVTLLNQLDRLVLSVVAEPLRLELGLSDTQLGLLSGLTFAVFFTFFGIPLARIADTWRRPWLLGICVTLWSAMTVLTGGVTSYTQLLLLRIGLAIGEAGCQPATHTLIADYVPPARRVSAFSIITAGGSLGTMLSLLLGGLLLDAVGWRWTVAIVGLIGLPVAALVGFTIPEPRMAAGFPERQPLAPFRDVLRWAIGNRPYLTLVAAAVFCLAPTAAVSAWAPVYFMRIHHLSGAEVGLSIGIASGLGNLVGVIGLGLLADRIAKGRPDRALLLAATTMAICGPLYAAAFLATGAKAAAALYILPMCLHTTWFAPLFATIQTIAPPNMRAQAAAIALFVNCLLGLGLGPTLTGVLSDALAPTLGTQSLGVALATLGACTLLGAAALLMASLACRAR